MAKGQGPLTAKPTAESRAPSAYQPSSTPISRRPVTLFGVDRAVAELRRGRPVVLQGGGGGSLVLAAEAVTEAGIEQLSGSGSGPVRLALTARRAQVIGLVASPGEPEAPVQLVEAPGGLTLKAIQALTNPLSPDQSEETLLVNPAKSFSGAEAGIRLAKLARLLPAVLVAEIDGPDSDDLALWAHRRDWVRIDSGDIFQYDTTQALSLRAVSEARVPLLDAEATRIIAFRPLDGGLEHLAIVIGEPDEEKPVLIRLHSECFTGDLLGSLRCDCGDQLRGAIAEISLAGAGVLLYLAQEGRGIGLVNKLRAYQLQDDGLDTMDANLQLGFDADERVYLPAAEMIRALGFSAVKLLTNNPDKVGGLEACGITVAERVSHQFPSNQHNEAYLRTKADKGGHLF
ncbi:MAG: GTP cyclohydrolase II RibA [Magnetovibrionaceae bacterium]